MADAIRRAIARANATRGPRSTWSMRPATPERDGTARGCWRAAHGASRCARSKSGPLAPPAQKTIKSINGKCSREVLDARFHSLGSGCGYPPRGVV